MRQVREARRAVQTCAPPSHRPFATFYQAQLCHRVVVLSCGGVHIEVVHMGARSRL